MNNTEIVTTIHELADFVKMKHEIDSQIEALQDVVKNYMNENGLDEMLEGGHHIIYREITSNKFDSQSFRKMFEDIYKDFCKPCTTKPFKMY